MNAPPAVDEHTAVVNDDNMYIFGGFVDGDRTNQVFIFNFKLGEWKLLIIQEGYNPPCARAGHSSVVASDNGT